MAKKAATKKATPTPQEQFATLVETYRGLPADDPNAFKGKEPNSPASDYQKKILTNMGMNGLDGLTKLDAHASMKAFGDLYPEKNKEIWEQQKKEVDAAKAEKGGATAATPPGFTKYTVRTADVGKPATFHQIVQLNAAGIRKYSEETIPTRGEVADKLNALQTKDIDKYNAAMSAANDTVAKWKQQPPSENQIAFANAAGIKVADFVAGADGKRERGSTAFSVNEKIHDLRCTDVNAYNAAKSATEAQRTAATPKATTPKLSAADKVAAAVNEKAASEAAKTGTVPTLNIPAAPAVQAEGPQAGE